MNAITVDLFHQERTSHSARSEPGLNNRFIVSHGLDISMKCFSDLKMRIIISPSYQSLKFLG